MLSFTAAGLLSPQSPQQTLQKALSQMPRSRLGEGWRQRACLRVQSNQRKGELGDGELDGLFFQITFGKLLEIV